MLGERIKCYILDIGLKQTVVAERANIPQNTLSAMLNDKRKITAEEYFAICKALGVNLELFAS